MYLIVLFVVAEGLPTFAYITILYVTLNGLDVFNASGVESPGASGGRRTIEDSPTEEECRPLQQEPKEAVELAAEPAAEPAAEVLDRVVVDVHAAMTADEPNSYGHYVSSDNYARSSATEVTEPESSAIAQYAISPDPASYAENSEFFRSTTPCIECGQSDLVEYGRNPRLRRLDEIGSAPADDHQSY